MDPYCNLCGNDKRKLFSTRDGKTLCTECGKTEGLCRVCGTTRKEGETKGQQLHYKPECYR